MSVTAVATHPILGAVATARAALGEVADVQPVFMSTTEKQAALVEFARLEAQAAEGRLRVLACADDVGEDPAKALDARALVAAGMRAGAVSEQQARVIATGIEELPQELGADLRRDAEATLVGFAAHHRPIELRRLARRILDVVAPEIAEAEEGKRLEAEEQRAQEKVSLKFRDLGDGTTRYWGVTSTPTAGRWKTYLQASTSPRQGARDGCSAPSTSGGERVPQHRAYGRAFNALLEGLDPDGLPEHGGDATTVMVTMTIDQLRADLATAGILTGDGEASISAEQARRLACQAAIIPVVLGGKGEVLDLGRSRRLFSRAQRKAARLRDRGCRAEGCTVPAAWTEAHHRKPWSEGGKTDLDDLISFCNHDHHRIHDARYSHELLANGKVRFHRRR